MRTSVALALVVLAFAAGAFVTGVAAQAGPLVRGTFGAAPPLRR